ISARAYHAISHPANAGWQKYVLQVAPEDCTGCNLCVEVCPAKDRQNPEIKAINMMSRLEHVEEEKINYDFWQVEEEI
ncbi:4Fe-4S binding protein, partial [Escherichia sp. HC-CC]